MAVREVSKKEITKDGRKWIYDVTLSGKRYKSKKYLTKKEASLAERDFINKLERNVDQCTMSLYDLFEDHYDYQKDKVKVSTLYNYRTRLNYYKCLFNIKLDQLDIKDIERWKKEMNSLSLSTSTKNDLLKYLKATLNYGSKWYDFNFSSVYNKITNFNNPNEVKKEMDFYTYEEFKKFISAETDLKFKTLYECLYYLGLRRGELMGLTWKHVSFENNEISIVQNLVRVSGDHGNWIITTPKTRTSFRKVPIPKVLLDDLIELKEESSKMYGFNDKWFVFGNYNPINQDTIRRHKNTLAAKAGVKQIRTHDFRHSCASLLINNGANVVMVAKYLGHSRIEQTLNTYSHIFKNKLDDVVNTIDNL